MKISSSGVDHTNCSPKGEINPRNKVGETPLLSGHSLFFFPNKMWKMMYLNINVLTSISQCFLKEPKRRKRATKNNQEGDKGLISHFTDKKSKTLVCAILLL